MFWLLVASLIWGFSFGLIKGQTTGVDPFVLGSIRAAIATIFFLPWYFRPKAPKISKPLFKKALICGMIQIGFMYGPYTLAFKYLKAHEVALFTMTTPIIMAIILALLSKQISKSIFGASILATLGGAVVAWKDVASDELIFGIILVQFSNTLFATGLILWRRWLSSDAKLQTSLMFPYFLGATAGATLLALLFGTSIRFYDQHEWLVFMWLGIVASGVGFSLWNRGALQVSSPTLVAANNIKLPIGILISLVVFREQADLSRLFIGGILILLALKISEQKPKAI